MTTDERNVQRFSGWGIAMMQEKPTAGYVLASDYDALAADIERLQLLAADYGGQLTAARTALNIALADPGTPNRVRTVCQIALEVNGVALDVPAPTPPGCAVCGLPYCHPNEH